MSDGAWAFSPPRRRNSRRGGTIPHFSCPQGEPARPALPSEDEPAGTLWIRQGDFVKPVQVRIGLSDGAVTEISGDGLAEGTEVIVGANRIESDADALSILPHTWSK